MIKKHTGFDLHLKLHTPESARYAFTFITLFIALILIYSNSFHCQWHMDDFGNIFNNPNIQLKSISGENIQKSFYGRNKNEERLSRPLSYLSFALNYHIGGTNVFGYHVVNFAIHYIAAIFLFLLLYNTLRLPILKEQYKTTAYPVALVSVFLWAIHPIQVSAVTYIVQRMASMAGMFYIMAMYLYLKARTTNNPNKRIALFALCGIAAVCSFASKENAAMLPASLFLFDLLLIQGLTKKSLVKNLKIIAIPFLTLLLIGIFYFDLSSILSGYQYRPFTLTERLLTEPRVILFYISLLLYPVSSRLTLLHDVEASTSLFTPWTTLPSILIILLIIVIALMISQKRPLISYCILFFFLNHLIEGSIIPLELIFEHRNYLPSMLIFVPVGILMVYVLDYFAYKKSIQIIMLSGFLLVLAAFGHTTYIRNEVFKNDLTLWYDNIEKAPNLHRPHHNLGKAYLVAGFYYEGVKEMEKALKSKAGGRTTQKYRTYYNLGVYYLQQEEYDKALAYFVKYIQHVPNQPKAYSAVAIIMLRKNNLKLAEKYIKKAIVLDPDSSELRKTVSMILLRKEEALE